MVRPAVTPRPLVNGNGAPVVSVSFEDTFDDELRQEVGDLGPDPERERAGGGGQQS